MIIHCKGCNRRYTRQPYSVSKCSEIVKCIACDSVKIAHNKIILRRTTVTMRETICVKAPRRRVIL